MGTTVLVTGGAGFIGSNLIERLLLEHHNVVCLDNFDLFYPESYKINNLTNLHASSLFKLVKGDIRDKVCLNKIFREHNIGFVVHLAAKAGVRPSILYQKEYYDVNLNGTINLLETMQEHGVKKLIFSSSSSVYGNNKKIPYSEDDHVNNPISPYAATKKAGELITHTFHHLYGFDVLNFRFFTVYGPRQRPDLAIHKFFKNIYAEVPTSIFGDGNTHRDYTFINDIVAGIVSGINLLMSKHNIYETINLGNNSPVKLKDLINSIETITGRKFILEHLPMQPGDVEMTFADIEKAKSILGYKPQTDLMSGLGYFNDWFLKNKIY